MILTKVILQDYGVYKGKNEFDFTTTPDKPIILIGGSNGAGKTTLFESIMLCFYGISTLGKRTSKKAYDEFLSKKFSVNGISFWKIFKNDFILFCKKRFSEILFFIDSLNKLLIKEDIKLLITLDDSQQIGRTATIFCNKKKYITNKY
jgi:AAA15 family ATPase/GTPase